MFGKTSTSTLANTPVWVGENQYLSPIPRRVLYDLNTSTRHFGKFGTILMPVQRVPVYPQPPHRGSRYMFSTPQYLNEHSAMVPYQATTGTQSFSMFSTTLIRVSDNSGSSVHPRKIPQVPVFSTEHPLEINFLIFL